MVNVVDVQNVNFAYDATLILKGIHMVVEPNTCMGLLGSNGSGKTTLIKCLIGELKGDGEIQVLNQRPNIHDIAYKKKLGIVLDNDYLLDYLTLEEYLWFIGRTYQLSPDVIQKEIDFWLEQFDLTNDRKRILKYFSHGMRKKTQIIAAVMHKPELLIVDEPTNGLDIEMIYTLKKIILELKSRMTVIISTHHLSFVEEICDYVYILNKGHILDRIHLKTCGPQLEAIFMNEIENGRAQYE